MPSWNGSGREPEPRRSAVTLWESGREIVTGLPERTNNLDPGRVRLSPYSAFDEEDDEIVAIYEPPAEIEVRYRIAPEFRPLPATDVPVLHLDAPGLCVSSLGFGLQSAVPHEKFRREPPPVS